MTVSTSFLQVIFSGTFNAVALCLLIWIYLFTAAHEEDEAKLVSLLVSVVAPDETSEPMDTAGNSVPPAEESEF